MNLQHLEYENRDSLTLPAEAAVPLRDKNKAQVMTDYGSGCRMKAHGEPHG
jgi:hypothetical protein